MANSAFTSGGSGPAASGDRIEYDVTQASHGFSVGDWIYRTTSGTYAKAVSTSEIGADAIGVVRAVADTSNFTVQTAGYYDQSGVPTGTAGDGVFLSSTAGVASTSYPSLSTQWVKPLGILIVSATSMLIQMMRGNPNSE